MRETTEQGLYKGYEEILATYNRKRKECPKGISLKIERKNAGTYLYLQFTYPDTGKRSAKPCGEDFTEDGIIRAVSKAHKVNEALGKFEKASEFWVWYDKEILGKNTFKNDLTTYSEIFKKLEDRYFAGRNKNTRRRRSREIPNDVTTFNTQYTRIFNKFSNWDKYPEWQEIKNALFTWKQGSKAFKEAYITIKNICKLAHNKNELLENLAEIDSEQTEFKEKQSISLKEFLEWYDQAYSEIECLGRKTERDAREKWLWVASMCVVYGLRPTEVAASLNLDKPYRTKAGTIIKALNDPTNTTLELVLGDFTYFGVSIKTGNRICACLLLDKQLIDKLDIQKPKLPIYIPQKESNAKTITNGFNKQFYQRMDQYKCPVSQLYAFRHLSNQLGEKYGIPQEIRSRLLGHTVAVNDRIYKQRSNEDTTLDILRNYSKQPLSYDLAINALESIGIDINDPSVKLVLKIIYQLS